MMSAEFHKKIMDISKFLEKEGEGISYISNKGEFYTIGTKIYSDKIAKFLDENVPGWEGSEANIMKKKGKNQQEKGKKVGYLWKIPVEREE